jgi:hypothetical protein
VVLVLILVGGAKEKNQTSAEVTSDTAGVRVNQGALHSKWLFKVLTPEKKYLPPLTTQDAPTDSVQPSLMTLPEAAELTEQTEPTAEATSGPEEAAYSAEAVPSETAVPEMETTVAQSLPAAVLIEGQATHYGESYNGSSLGCGGVYSSADTTIIAVSPARYAEWQCGTQIQICGPAGCIIAMRRDACPGCYANLVDLSEEGNALVCGVPSTCRVTLQVVQ